MLKLKGGAGSCGTILPIQEHLYTSLILEVMFKSLSRSVALVIRQFLRHILNPYLTKLGIVTWQWTVLEKKIIKQCKNHCVWIKWFIKYFFTILSLFIKIHILSLKTSWSASRLKFVKCYQAPSGRALSVKTLTTFLA